MIERLNKTQKAFCLKSRNRHTYV